jgi:myo-inositol-1(or 4)-monophosphatase
MVESAAIFAEKAHEGAFRKGTKIPYITHPLEAAVIVSGLTTDREVIAAALLHDVVEDAGVTEEELRQRFGKRVAGLVMDASEDKSKSWQERKGATLRFLETASRDARIVALGDKLSNLRCTARDYMLLGEEIWNRFNEKDKKKHALYYWGIADVCEELREHPYYKEYVMLCRSVFGDRK